MAVLLESLVDGLVDADGHGELLLPAFLAEFRRGEGGAWIEFARASGSLGHVLTLLLVLAVAPTPVRVAVVDVSAPDAVYEDVSRALADDVVRALNAAGAEALRVDEGELPEDGCRAGPCLAAAAKSHQADVLVALDAAEDGKKTKVGVLALQGQSGLPLTAVRYVVSEPGRVPKPLKVFAAAVLTAVEKARAAQVKAEVKRAAAADAGTTAAPAVPHRP